MLGNGPESENTFIKVKVRKYEFTYQPTKATYYVMEKGLEAFVRNSNSCIFEIDSNDIMS